MNRNTKKGFLTLEAAIFLPVFIIAVLTFGFLIKVVSAEEQIIHGMTDEARRLSLRSYHLKIAPTFESTLRKRLQEENPDLADWQIDTFQYRFKSGDKEDLISLRVNCYMKTKLPIVFYEGFDLSEVLLFRGFTGREQIPEEINYEEMETLQESHLVWVFPTAGERYHESDCSYINVAARQGLLDQGCRRQYKPCALCRPNELPNGSIIYYFDKTGEAYHKGSCYIVDRYVISMEEEDAVRKGYRPCSKCIN